jgi:hypothetical protein
LAGSSRPSSVSRPMAATASTSTRRDRSGMSVTSCPSSTLRGCRRD